ncbi:MAG: hypothetical protein RLZ33_158 [Bacteroidota bacterium]|jgi:hypothetical protein
MNLIPDEEIDNLQTSDLLGTLPYVNTLHEIVTTCKTPFNIGLLAGWGGGKSSIVETLLKRIKDENQNKPDKDIEVFKYDAWKYSEDPFRRTFIIELLNKFKIKGYENLDSLLYDNSSTEKEGQTKFNGNRLFSYVYLIPLLLLFIWFTNENETLKVAVTSGAFISGVILFVLKEMFTTYKITIHKSKMIEPEKFELIFEEMVHKILKRKRTVWKWIKGTVGISEPESKKKLLIVIDNIDRCHEELVIQLLLTIKNFLDKKNVIFILPIDEKGVTFFLKQSNQDATEFLRKIFNTTIRIKSFSNDEMFDFSWNLVQNYQLESMGISREIVHMACQEYTTNPRKIIQFLNNFQMEIHLVHEQESNEYLKDDQVSNNFEFLAKLSIIREEWPDLYAHIFENQHLLSKIDKALIENQYKESGESYIVSGDAELPKLNKRQYLFFKRTRGIQANGDIEPFLVNRDLLKDIPDVINQHISGGNWLKIKESLNNEELTFPLLIDAIKKRFDTDINKRKLFSSTGVSIFVLVNQLIQDDEFATIFEDCYSRRECRFIVQLISSSEFAPELKKLTSGEIIPLAKWLSDKGELVLRNKAVEILNGPSINDSDSTQVDYVLAFVQTFRTKLAIIKKLAKRLSELIINQPQLIDKINPILEDSSLFNNLIQTGVFDNFIDNLGAQTFQTERNKILVLKRALDNERLTQVQLDKYISTAIPHLNNNGWEALPNVYSALIGFIERTNNLDVHTTVYNMMQNRQSFLIQTLSSGHVNEPQLECYKSQIILLNELSKVSDTHRPTCLSWINQFVATKQIEDISVLSLNIYDALIEESINNDLLPAINQSLVHLNEIVNKIEAINIASKEILRQENVADASFNAIFENCLIFYFINENEVVDTLVSFMDAVSVKENLKNCIINRVNNITESGNKKKFLKLIDKLQTKELAGHLISNIISETNQNPAFAENIQFIIDNYTNGKKAVSDVLSNNLKDEGDSETLKVLISIIIDNKSILHKSMIHAAISELKQFIVSKDINELRYALNTLDKLEKTDLNTTILKWLLPIIKDSTVELTEEDIAQKDRIMTKFK